MTPKPREDSLDDEPPCAHEPRDTYAQAPWAGGAGADAATAGDGRSARGILVPPQTSSRRPSLQSVRVSFPASCRSELVVSHVWRVPDVRVAVETRLEQLLSSRLGGLSSHVST